MDELIKRIPNEEPPENTYRSIRGYVIAAQG